METGKTFDPELVAQLKKQIVEELKTEEAKKLELEAQRREEQRTEYEKYVETMKASPDPWVDVQGWSTDEKGVKVELEWNDAFVDYLRANGITGTDDEQVVQRWVTLLLRDMADQMSPEGDYE